MKELQMTKIRESSAGVRPSSTTVHKARSKEEIVEAILKAIGSDPGKTNCMHQSNMSYSMLTNYLNWLQRDGLIESKSSDKEGLFLTEEGETFYNVLRHVNKALRKNTHIEERARQLSELDLKKAEPSRNQARASEYKRRSDSEIICDILNLTRNNNLFTHIMYSVGITYAICKSKLNMLEKYGFVEKIESSLGRNPYHGRTHTVYHNTEQGDQLHVALEYINSILYPERSVSFVKIQRT